jgi:hypothetical protein
MEVLVEHASESTQARGLGVRRESLLKVGEDVRQTQVVHSMSLQVL